MKKIPKGTTRRGGRQAGKCYKPPLLQQQVQLDAAQGKSQRQIAQERNIHRRTVVRILTQEELLDRVHRTKARLFNSLEKAAENVSSKIEAGDYTASHDALSGLGIYATRTKQEISLEGPSMFDGREYDEKDFYAKFAQTRPKNPFPTPEERQYFKVHGHWPQEEKSVS